MLRDSIQRFRCSLRRARMICSRLEQLQVLDGMRNRPPVLREDLLIRGLSSIRLIEPRRLDEALARHRIQLS